MKHPPTPETLNSAAIAIRAMTEALWRSQSTLEEAYQSIKRYNKADLRLALIDETIVGNAAALRKARGEK